MLRQEANRVLVPASEVQGASEDDAVIGRHIHDVRSTTQLYLAGGLFQRLRDRLCDLGSSRACSRRRRQLHASPAGQPANRADDRAQADDSDRVVVLGDRAGGESRRPTSAWRPRRRAARVWPSRERDSSSHGREPGLGVPGRRLPAQRRGRSGFRSAPVLEHEGGADVGLRKPFGQLSKHVLGGCGRKCFDITSPAQSSLVASAGPSAGHRLGGDQRAADDEHWPPALVEHGS